MVYLSLWRYWALPVIWTLAIMALSGDLGSGSNTFSIFKWVLTSIVTLNPDTLSLLHFYFRKVLHVIGYGVLSVLWFQALSASYPERSSANRILALVLCLMVAIIDEGHQFLLASRSGSLRDVALDMTGSVLFLFTTVSYWKRKMIIPSEAKPPFF